MTFGVAQAKRRGSCDWWWNQKTSVRTWVSPDKLHMMARKLAQAWHRLYFVWIVGGYEKRVAGKSLDLTVTLFIGDRIWGYSWNTSYEPCCDIRTGIITGKPCMNPIRYSLWAYIMENLYRPCCDVRIGLWRVPWTRQKSYSPAIIVVFSDYSLSPS